MSTGTQSRGQSRGEELANSIIHGAGLLGSLIVLPWLVATAAARATAAEVVGAAVFGSALVLLYGASTLYHAVRSAPAKQVLRVIDHSAIYLLIAGSYTPFVLGALRGPWGWTLLAVIWTIAAAGIAAKVLVGFRYPHLSTALYVAMGWLIVVAIKPLVTHVPRPGLLWLLAGGLCYTGGVVFYARDARLRFGHALWHLFVLAGSACHVVAVALYSGARPA